MERAAIYCRVSTKDQKDRGSSLETQERDDRRYCEEHGYEAVWSGAEDATGADMERAGLRELRAKVRANELDVVVVWALDRLSRDQVHQTVLLWEMDDHNCRLELVTESFDDTPEGRFLRQVRGFMAEVEREKIRLRTREGVLRRIESGALMPGGTPRFGYAWGDQSKRYYEIDPEAASVVEFIFRSVAGGMTLTNVCRVLEDRGVPTPTRYFASLGLYKATPAPRWIKSTLRAMIICPSYKGEHVTFRERVTKELRQDPHTGERTKVWVVKLRGDDDELRRVVGEDVVPAIVDAATWEAANARMARNQRVAFRNSVHTKEALLRAGFVVCGVCGKGLYVRYRAEKLDKLHYASNPGQCNSHGADCSAVWLEGRVWDHVTRFISNEDTMRAALDQFRERAADQGDEDGSTLRGYEMALTQIAKKRTNLLHILEDEEDPDTIEELRGRLEELKGAAAKQKAARDGLLAMLANRDAYQQSVEALVEWAQDVKGSVENMGLEERRELLYLLGVQVRLYRAGVVREETGERWEIEYTWEGLNATAGASTAPAVAGTTS